uniref:Uncharacterized protein n=1 Tax=Lupinus angustifolius TaxID=3871 RepID=L0P109_LUPAN|nr:hypothetical protein [Lupinus angustifolius]
MQQKKSKPTLEQESMNHEIIEAAQTTVIRNFQNTFSQAYPSHPSKHNLHQAK